MEGCHRSGFGRTRGLWCLAAVLLSGCATVFTGTKDTLRFVTEPRGAELSISGERVCRTPCQTGVRRSLAAREAILRLEGYREERFRLLTDFNYVSVANFGFLYAWAIDIATGSVMRYRPREYRFELRPEEARSGGDQAVSRRDSLTLKTNR